MRGSSTPIYKDPYLLSAELYKMETRIDELYRLIYETQQMNLEVTNMYNRFASRFNELNALNLSSRLVERDLRELNIRYTTHINMLIRFTAIMRKMESVYLLYRPDYERKPKCP
jgi:hypothetical protein